MDWKSQLASSIDAAVHAAVEASVKRALQPTIDDMRAYTDASKRRIHRQIEEIRHAVMTAVDVCITPPASTESAEEMARPSSVAGVVCGADLEVELPTVYSSAYPGSATATAKSNSASAADDHSPISELVAALPAGVVHGGVLVPTSATTCSSLCPGGDVSSMVVSEEAYGMLADAASTACRVLVTSIRTDDLDVGASASNATAMEPGWATVTPTCPCVARDDYLDHAPPTTPTAAAASSLPTPAVTATISAASVVREAEEGGDFSPTVPPTSSKPPLVSSVVHEGPDDFTAATLSTCSSKCPGGDIGTSSTTLDGIDSNSVHTLEAFVPISKQWLTLCSLNVMAQRLASLRFAHLKRCQPWHPHMVATFGARRIFLQINAQTAFSMFPWDPGAPVTCISERFTPQQHECELELGQCTSSSTLGAIQPSSLEFFSSINGRSGHYVCSIPHSAANSATLEPVCERSLRHVNFVNLVAGTECWDHLNLGVQEYLLDTTTWLLQHTRASRDFVEPLIALGACVTQLTNVSSGNYYSNGEHLVACAPACPATCAEQVSFEDFLFAPVLAGAHVTKLRQSLLFKGDELLQDHSFYSLITMAQPWALLQFVPLQSNQLWPPPTWDPGAHVSRIWSMMSPQSNACLVLFSTAAGVTKLQEIHVYQGEFHCNFLFRLLLVSWPSDEQCPWISPATHFRFPILYGAEQFVWQIAWSLIMRLKQLTTWFSCALFIHMEHIINWMHELQFHIFDSLKVHSLFDWEHSSGGNMHRFSAAVLYEQTRSHIFWSQCFGFPVSGQYSIYMSVLIEARHFLSSSDRCQWHVAWLLCDTLLQSYLWFCTLGIVSLSVLDHLQWKIARDFHYKCCVFEVNLLRTIIRVALEMRPELSIQTYNSVLSCCSIPLHTMSTCSWLQIPFSVFEAIQWPTIRWFSYACSVAACMFRRPVCDCFTVVVRLNVAACTLHQIPVLCRGDSPQPASGDFQLLIVQLRSSVTASCRYIAELIAKGPRKIFAAYSKTMQLNLVFRGSLFLSAGCVAAPDNEQASSPIPWDPGGAAAAAAPDGWQCKLPWIQIRVHSSQKVYLLVAPGEFSHANGICAWLSLQSEFGFCTSRNILIFCYVLVQWEIPWTICLVSQNSRFQYYSAGRDSLYGCKIFSVGKTSDCLQYVHRLECVCCLLSTSDQEGSHYGTGPVGAQLQLECLVEAACMPSPEGYLHVVGAHLAGALLPLFHCTSSPVINYPCAVTRAAVANSLAHNYIQEMFVVLVGQYGRSGIVNLWDLNSWIYRPPRLDIQGKIAWWLNLQHSYGGNQFAPLSYAEMVQASLPVDCFQCYLTLNGDCHYLTSGIASTVTFQFLASIAMWSCCSLEFCQGKFSWDPGIWEVCCFCGFFTEAEAERRRHAATPFYYRSHCLDRDYSYKQVGVGCYFKLVKVCLHDTKLDLGDILKRQVPWDPGGSTRYWLEVKPKFKEGGMLASSLLLHEIDHGLRHWDRTWAAPLGLGREARESNNYKYTERDYDQGGLELDGFGLHSFCLSSSLVL